MFHWVKKHWIVSSLLAFVGADIVYSRVTGTPMLPATTPPPPIPQA